MSLITARRMTEGNIFSLFTPAGGGGVGGYPHPAADGGGRGTPIQPTGHFPILPDGGYPQPSQQGLPPSLLMGGLPPSFLMGGYSHPS